jgi:hypothetical protein
MPRTERLEAQPIDRILDRETREVVGWLYRWDNDDLVPMWKDGPKTNVIYEEGSMFSLKADDSEVAFKPVQSACEETLRSLGASYMRDPTDKGILSLFNPANQVIATFDIWADEWIDASDPVA